MEALVSLAVAVPLLVATLLVAFDRVLSHAVASATSVLACLASSCMLAALVPSVLEAPLVTWVSGRAPVDGFPVGIGLVADGPAAGLGSLGGLLAAGGIVYATRFWDTSRALFQALMLVAVASYVGLLLSGDLFTLFLFLELSAVASYALTAHRSDERQVIQGGFAQGVLMTVSGGLFAFAVGLLYARTGTLNLASMQRALLETGADAPVLAATALLGAALFVKAGAVPFHFAHADAHTVAPTPALMMMSAYVTPVGAYALLRIASIVFAPSGLRDEVATGLMAIGVLSAVVGAAAALVQDDPKRLLAFSGIAHLGFAFAAAGLWTDAAMAGAGLYLMTHGAVLAALYAIVAVGGRGALALVGVLALAGAPPFGTFAAAALIDHAALAAGQEWLGVLQLYVAALTAGAVLGLDRENEPVLRSAALIGPAIGLLAVALVLGVWRAVPRAALAAGHQLLDAQGYASAVLDGQPTQVSLYPPPPPSATSYALAIAACVGAFAVARIARRVPGSALLRRVHSGDARDYVAWTLIGAAALAVALFVWR